VLNQHFDIALGKALGDRAHQRVTAGAIAISLQCAGPVTLVLARNLGQPGFGLLPLGPWLAAQTADCGGAVKAVMGADTANVSTVRTLIVIVDK
jgi:hypothetical protein